MLVQPNRSGLEELRLGSTKVNHGAEKGGSDELENGDALTVALAVGLWTGGSASGGRNMG